MEMCVIAVRYYYAKDMVIVEKGDDVHGWLKSPLQNNYRNFPSVRKVKLKVDYGTVGYHAGRFHNGHRYLVDPVRAFLKHFTRLSDENVTTDELYRSYISRATDYSDADFEFLLVACQQHYPHYTATQIFSMIDTVVKMRDRDYFGKYCKLRVPESRVVVDTKTNCLMNCVRALRPRMPKKELRKYSQLTIEDAKFQLREDGIPYHEVTSGDPAAEVGVIQLTRTHARVTVRTVKGPPMAFNSDHAHSNKFEQKFFHLYDQL